MTGVAIRAERAADASAVAAVLEAAFGRKAEADIVAALRARRALVVALVAEDRGAVVGCIHFSRVLIEDGRAAHTALGLAPVAVAPERQAEGIGAALIRAGLEACRAVGEQRVVVLGEPGYYRRFGFAPARRFGIRFPAEVPEDAFMALALDRGALRGVAGVARFAPEFAVAS